MKAKLAAARAKGRGGWYGQECNAQLLSDMLRAHVEKGDPRDVANFCMFLHQRGEVIQPAVGELERYRVSGNRYSLTGMKKGDGEWVKYDDAIAYGDARAAAAVASIAKAPAVTPQSNEP
jgi:hypothetical protein